MKLDSNVDVEIEVDVLRLVNCYVGELDGIDLYLLCKCLLV